MTIRRREFIAVLGAAAVARPFAASAQQATKPVIGFLHVGSPQPYAPMMAAFLQGLSEAGFVEARNVMIEYRWAENQADRLPAMAADLVRRGVDVIAPAGGPASVRAAKTATTTIPIVFSLGSDPVKMGFVDSLNRPGGNVTGVTFLANELEAKQLDLLSELVPRTDSIAYLVAIRIPRRPCGQLVRCSDDELTFSMPVPNVTWTLPSPGPANNVPARSSSAPIRFSRAGVNRSSHWRSGMQCRQCTSFAGSSQPAVRLFHR